MIGNAYFPVALGSPGPLDRKIPSGLNSSIFFDPVFAGTIVISVLNL